MGWGESRGGRERRKEEKEREGEKREEDEYLIPYYLHQNSFPLFPSISLLLPLFPSISLLPPHLQTFEFLQKLMNNHNWDQDSEAALILLHLCLFLIDFGGIRDNRHVHNLKKIGGNINDGCFLKEE